MKFQQEKIKRGKERQDKQEEFQRELTKQQEETDKKKKLSLFPLHSDELYPFFNPLSLIHC
jgi:hypothetical protein